MVAYPVLCKVRIGWHEEDGFHESSRLTLLYAQNFTDAMRQLEDYYGEEILNVHIELFEESLIEMPIDSYDLVYKSMNEGV